MAATAPSARPVPPPAPPLAAAPSPTCPAARVVALVDGRWKLLVLWRLTGGPLRYGALRRAVPAASERMLIQTLRALEADGLVHREAVPVVPPRVTYRLTARGHALTPVLEGLMAWGEAHLPDLAGAPPPAPLRPVEAGELTEGAAAPGPAPAHPGPLAAASPRGGA